MFYSAQILSKKGPLGPIWIASWGQRGLKRTDVFNCSLPAAVDSIINPEAPLALRLSGQLLLGLVRLYLRKLQFLEEDAGLALRGLARNAAGGGGGTQVDLPDGGLAPEMAITLQDAGYDSMAQFVGNDLFPTFESTLFPEAAEGGGGWGQLSTGAGAGAGSVTMAGDISELFGSHWTGPGGGDERLELDGDAMERRFSTELERLRSQGIEAPRDPKADLFFGGAPDETFSPVMDDEVMAVPPEDMFAGPAPTPGRTPGSVGGPLGGAAPLPGLSDMRITPPSLPGLPDLGGGASGATSAGGFALGDDVEPLPMSDGMEGMDGMEAPPPEGELAEAGASAQQQRRRRQPPAHRRRRPTVDVQADGRPATTLPSEQIRKLLADRKPLMVRRGLRTQRQAATLPPRGFDVAAQSEAARDSQLFRPAAFSALAPELLDLFTHAMRLPGAAGEEAGPEAQRRRRSSRGTVAADEEAAAAAAAAVEVAAEDAAAAAIGLEEEQAPLTGGFSDAAPFSAGGDWGDDSLELADTQGAGAGRFLATAEEEGQAGAAAERRGRLPLQPVASSGDLGSIGPGSSVSGAAAQQTSFTRNTALVLEHLRREFAPATGAKRRHPSVGGLAADVAALSLDSLLGVAPGQQQHQRHGRLEAARWFYESLVLRNTGFVGLQQAVPYGDIAITPAAGLAGGRGSTPSGGAPPAP